MDFLNIYNDFMNETFSGNEFLVGLVTVWLISAMSYILVSVPGLIRLQVLKHMTTSMTLDSGNDIYSVIIKYLENMEVISSSRFLLLSNGRWGGDDLVIGMGVGAQILIYEHQPIFFKVEKEDSKDTVIYGLTMRKFGRSHDLFYNMIKQAMSMDVDENKTEYYNLGNDGPSFITSQKKQYTDSMVLSRENLAILNNIKAFTTTEDFHIKNNIPYQLGILLYGVPGSGKTSFIRALAGELDKHVVVVNSLMHLSNISSASEDSLIVIEEIDTLLVKRDARVDLKDVNIDKTPQKETTNYSLARMLTDLDGLIQVHGRIVVMTTNHPEKLDPALVRPGRIDYKMQFDYFDKEMFKQIVQQYYNHTMGDDYVMHQCSGAELQLAFRQGLDVQKFIAKHTAQEQRPALLCG